jgi:hypothetical protein
MGHDILVGQWTLGSDRFDLIWETFCCCFTPSFSEVVTVSYIFRYKLQSQTRSRRKDLQFGFQGGHNLPAGSLIVHMATVV